MVALLDFGEVLNALEKCFSMGRLLQRERDERRQCESDGFWIDDGGESPNDAALLEPPDSKLSAAATAATTSTA
jgi:hypothetical protein